MTNVGYYNGKLGPFEEMTIPMSDRAIYFGDGVYDATTFCNNRIFAAKDHLDRFYNSCKLLEIKFDMPREELIGELQKCIDATDADTGMLYWQATRGNGPRGHAFPPADVKPSLLIFTAPMGRVPLDTQARLISMEDTRFLHCNIKTLNLIPSVIAYQRCCEQGCFETVFHRGDIVTECAHSNILMMKDGVVYTHPRNNLILPGISLKHILELAPSVGLKTKEEPFTLEQLKAADEVIISSSGGLCIRAVEMDGQPVGCKDKEAFDKLQMAVEHHYLKDVGLE